MRELQILREEIWAALSEHVRPASGDGVYLLARKLGAAIDTMATISSSTYGTELKNAPAEAGAGREAASRSAVCSVSADVTARKQAEEEHERLLAEVQRQAEARQRYLDRLNTLLQASTTVLRETTAQGLLQAVADAARKVTGARVAASGHGYVSGAFRVGAESHAPGAAPCPPGQEFRVERGGVYLDLVYERESIRLTDEEMRRHPHWWGLPPDHGPLRGLLGARLVGRGGQPNGVLMVTDKQEGEFSGEDETLLRQLAVIASLGLQHAEARDEAERRAAEMDATIGAIRDGLLILGPHDELVHMNGPAERIAGVTTEQWTRLPPAERSALIHAETPEGQPLPLGETPRHRALRGETVVGFHMAIRRPDGSRRDVLTSSAPIRDDEGRIIGAVAHWADITSLVELQSERERLLAQVEALLVAERQARERAEDAVHARDQFLAAAAHELKTPVTNLRGFAQISLRRLDREGALDPQRARRTLQTIDWQADRLARLVNQLLDVASLESGQLALRRRDVDLAALVQGVVAGAQAATRRHALRLQAPPSMPARVDQARIEQVLANLLDNASKFSPEDTPVDIELTTPSPGLARLTVRDYGPGVPPERRDRLFSRFYQAQTGRPFSGLGLGLYYARQVVELHGGHVEAEFPPDGGTRIVVTLPTARPLV